MDKQTASKKYHSAFSLVAVAADKTGRLSFQSKKPTGTSHTEKRYATEVLAAKHVLQMCETLSAQRVGKLRLFHKDTVIGMGPVHFGDEGDPRSGIFAFGRACGQRMYEVFHHRRGTGAGAFIGTYATMDAARAAQRMPAGASLPATFTWTNLYQLLDRGSKSAPAAASSASAASAADTTLSTTTTPSPPPATGSLALPAAAADAIAAGSHHRPVLRLRADEDGPEGEDDETSEEDEEDEGDTGGKRVCSGKE